MGFYCRLLFFFNLFFPPYFVYPVGFFQFKANVKKKKNKASMSIVVHVFVWMFALISLR